jgi:hypothetical protein
LPEISPFTRKLAPKRAPEPTGIETDDRLTSALMVLPSWGLTTGLVGCISCTFCATSVRAGAAGADCASDDDSGFLFHMKTSSV